MTKVLIVEARFYEDIADLLVAGAERVFDDVGFAHDRITVAGAFEIPGAIAMAEASPNPKYHYDGYLALGCVIRGETSHYDIVAGESARGLMDLSVRDHLAIANGILTCNTREQALVRADPAQKDKGGDVARALLTMMSLKRRWELNK